jgi:large subunit ribosomal protein L22
MSKLVVNSIGISAKKLKPVLDIIRNKSVGEAARVLRFLEKREIALVLLKALKSIPVVDSENIYNSPVLISQIYACQGVTIKRMMPRAQGRANIIKKRSSSVSILYK